MKDENNSNGGIGLAALVFLVFLVLKLTDIIDWSWWFITMPLYGGFAIMLVFYIIPSLLLIYIDRKRE